MEYTKEGLERQIHRMEIKVKSLSTMIANLQERKEKVNEEIELIARQFGQEGQDNEQLAKKMQELRTELMDINQKIAERQRTVDETNNEIALTKQRLTALQSEHRRAEESWGDDIDKEAAYLKANMNITYQKMLMETIEPLKPTLSEKQKEILQESGFVELTEKLEGCHQLCPATCLAICQSRYGLCRVSWWRRWWKSDWLGTRQGR